MKRLLAIFCLGGVLLLFGNNPAQAVPTYYIFDGTVTSNTVDLDDDFLNPEELTEIAEYTVGREVSFTVLIDLENNYMCDSWEFFYAEYIRGDSLQGDSATPSGEGGGAQSETNTTGGKGLLFADPPDDFGGDSVFHIRSVELMVEEWTIGTDNLIAWDWFGAGGRITYDLTLTTMSETDPVPEPGTFILFAVGLIGLMRFRIKLKK